LAKNPLPIADELLKFNRPRKEWKFEDLAPATKALAGRSFSNGKQMFKVATCISCHKLGGEGQEFGPDLTKLDPKWTNADVLRHILEPSLLINEKYQTYVFQLESGKSVTGIVVGETPKAYKVIENPLATTTPVTVKKDDIARKTKSPTSLMPKGLLDKLTREEILDLLAYVVAGGERKHKVFGATGGHEHHGH
jgi:putative heme-binding domain-containing protein